jgi:hypothetical protein
MKQRERKQNTNIIEKERALHVIRLIWAINFWLAETMLLMKNCQNNNLLKLVVLFSFNIYVLTVLH